MIRNLKKWFLSQGAEKQLAISFSMATVFIILAGPFETFRSYQRVFEQESLGRARQIVSRLAVDRANPETFLKENGVRRVFVTDSSGLIIYPEAEFHQDGRKYSSVRDVLNKGESVVKKNGKIFELVEPVSEGPKVVGSAYLEFSTAYSSIWRPMLMLVKSVFLISALMAALFYVGVRIFGKRRKMNPAENVVIEREDKIKEPPKFEHVNAPVVLFDTKFRISFANNAALAIDPKFIGKHIIDLDKKYVEMAEEMEMLQLVSVKKDSATLWRITENGEAGGYGLSF